MIRTVLVANRGEIAVRVIRACREMGLRTVAVYSEADAAAPHVWLADEAVALGPADPAQSYLHIGRIVDAARACGADAVHPGYGFLAENPAFAAACRDAGLTFVGPPAAVLAALGDKVAARRMAQRAGVPVVPGYDDPHASDDDLRREAGRVGFPLMLKARGGGGGRGIRVVHGPDALDAAIAAARGEALRAFGDGALFLERLLAAPRHVEVQVLADAAGRLVHLGERECSIQRNHQKIVEEAPSPAVDAGLRARLGEAALAVARAAGYVNAGTVEFLLDGAGRFYFLEVNPRLQVEHPVTELVTGLDLVRAQLRIAAGEPLEVAQPEVALRGAAIEARVYAERPEAGFAASPGRILYLEEPALPGVRVDSGIRAGLDVPVHYDPILAKVVAWAPDRPAAVARLRAALREYVLLGPHTNLTFLQAVLDAPAFRRGDLSTEFVARHLSGWAPPDPSPEVVALAAALADRDGPGRAVDRPTRPVGRAAAPPDPWERLPGWRLA